MDGKEREILTDAMERAGKLLAMHCEIAESVARANVQFMVGPDAELVETKGADLAESSLCAVERLSVVLERLAGADRKENTLAGCCVEPTRGKDDDMEQGNCIVIPAEKPMGNMTETMLDGDVCIIPDAERKELIVSKFGGGEALRLKKREAAILGKILIDQSQKL